MEKRTYEVIYEIKIGKNGCWHHQKVLAVNENEAKQIAYSHLRLKSGQKSKFIGIKVLAKEPVIVS